uniref:Uncharacterized protein n=1 Tax=Candidatus Kentrum sp. UNK TaxID=2126344 RepID=A0A451B237_9GAMM|nr:MAG: hypothetical protein BECKUNK1418H_GA0071006_11093 [Candidatus Kentron sp. UNK]
MQIRRLRLHGAATHRVNSAKSATQGDSKMNKSISLRPSMPFVVLLLMLGAAPAHADVQHKLDFESGLGGWSTI